MRCDWPAGHAANGDAARPAKRAKTGSKPPTCIVLDIEGTVAPITFVADVMFPYARQGCPKQPLFFFQLQFREQN